MEYICTVCNKEYSSYKSLWNHKKEYHPNKLAEIRQISLKMTNNESKSSEDNNSFKCRYCEKVYKHASSKCKHEKTCASKENTKYEIEEIKKQNEELKYELKEIKKLIKTNMKSKTVKNINNGNIINGNVINNYVIELGGENTKLLSEDQKLKVLKSINYGEYPVVTLVDELMKNEKNRNIKISNLQNNMALKYDGDIEKFKATSKKQVIHDIISVRKHDIRAFFEEFCDTNKINEKTKASIEKYLNKLNDSSENNVELRKFMNEHKEQIIFIIYNITLIEESEIEVENTMEI
jgi:hypothetical protein